MKVAPEPTGHERDHHKMPRRWLRRYRHRPWICYCGRAFVVRHKLGGDGGLADWVVYYWEEWQPVYRVVNP